MLRLLVIVATLAPACSKDTSASTHASAPSTSAAPHTAPTPGMGTKVEVTPELAEKARALLEAQPDAPLGTTVPFRLNGKDYVARFEEHENAEGDPDRPPGKHKGVTVYATSP